jgi:RNA recognition motif-containing protein
MKTNKVFVAGIAYRDLDGNPLTGRHGDQKLADLFSRAGKIAMKKLSRRDGTEVEVVAANIAVDRDTKLSRGFGFVEFETVESAEKAIEMFNGYEFEGRVITVRFSEPRAEGDAPRGNAGGYNRDRRN